MTYRKRFCISPIVLAATMFAVVSGPAGAADLYDGDVPPAAYEDRRYEEIYGHPTPRTHVRDERRSYTVRERYVEHRGDCLRPNEIRRVLYEDGWYDLDDLEIDGRFVRVEANRADTDREFDLVLDRCSGEILEARPDDIRHVRRFGHHHHHHHDHHF